jgi:CDP-glycerol glycerophosphotransferase
LFDYETTAPGPKLATTADVAAALLDLDRVSAGYAAARTEFNARFNSRHDGNARRRVVDEFFD